MTKEELPTSAPDLSLEEEILLQLDSLNSAERESLLIRRKQLSAAHDNGALFALACSFGFGIAAYGSSSGASGVASTASGVFALVFVIKAIRAIPW